MTSPINYVMMKGTEFVELGSGEFTPSVCAVCGKDARVVSASYQSLMQFVHAGSMGAYYPAKLGASGVPASSSGEAGYCGTCGKAFHLTCIEPLHLGGGTMFHCPNCKLDLAPYPLGLAGDAPEGSLDRPKKLRDAERQDVAAPPAPATPRKGWLRSLFTGEAATRVEARHEPSAPAAVAAPSSALAFTVRSLEVKQSHEYGSESSRSAITASDTHRILVVEVTFQNTTDRPRRFSSSQFSVLDGKGAVVEASFYGVGDTIAEHGAVIATESKTNDSDGNPIVSYKGKLSTNVSFLEWELRPHKTYEDRLVFVIPAAARGVTVQFKGDS